MSAQKSTQMRSSNHSEAMNGSSGPLESGERVRGVAVRRGNRSTRDSFYLHRSVAEQPAEQMLQTEGLIMADHRSSHRPAAQSADGGVTRGSRLLSAAPALRSRARRKPSSLPRACRTTLPRIQSLAHLRTASIERSNDGPRRVCCGCSLSIGSFTLADLLAHL